MHGTGACPWRPCPWRSPWSLSRSRRLQTSTTCESGTSMTGQGKALPERTGAFRGPERSSKSRCQTIGQPPVLEEMVVCCGVGGGGDGRHGGHRGNVQAEPCNRRTGKVHVQGEEAGVPLRSCLVAAQSRPPPTKGPVKTVSPELVLPEER
jgi:hypothetical protein